MATKEIVASLAAPSAIGPYSQGVRAGGTLYVSGCIGADAKTGNLVEGGVEAQTEQVLKNMNEILLAGGSTLNDVLKCTVLLRSMSDFAAVNAVYAKYFPVNPPARATFAVAGLPRDALVEIECIALVTGSPNRNHVAAATGSIRINPSAGDTNWEDVYKTTNNIQQLPWYYDQLDPDVAAALLEQKVQPPSHVLDIGCGPGTQARELAKAGFVATGSDLSATAITSALELSAKERAAGLPLTFIVDDLLVSKLLPSSFDAVVDRGVLHVIPPAMRVGYSKSVATVLKPGGILIVITFSKDEPGEKGPHRFTAPLVALTLKDNFDVISQKDSTYHGALKPQPKVIFSVLRRRATPTV